MESILFTLKQRYKLLLIRILPPEVDTSSEQAEDAARLLTLAILAAFLVPVFIGEFIYFELWSLAIPLSVAGLCMVSIPWIYKRTASLAAAREAFLISLFGFKLWESILFGSVIAPGSMWFACLPIIAILLGSPASGGIWLVVSIASMLTLHRVGLSNVFYTDSPTSSPEFLYTFSLVFMTVAVTVFVYMVDAARKKALRRLKRANAIVKALAERDPLTGVFNRRHVWEEMRLAERRANSSATTFFVFLLDIDNFKTINDSFGHGIGDTVLQKVASTLAEEVRETDCFGRYGGEEFILLLRSGNLRHPEEFAERLRKRVAALDFAEVRGPQQVTISIGVAQFQNGEEFGKTIKRADTALYAAKAAGRNAVMRAIADELGQVAAIRAG